MKMKEKWNFIVIASVVFFLMSVKNPMKIWADVVIQDDMEVPQEVAEETVCCRMEIREFNPLYSEEEPEEECLGEDAKTQEEIYVDSDCFTELESAALRVRQHLVNRENTFSIAFLCEDESEEYAKTIAKEIVKTAMSHTGCAVEGDYLRWQYESWSAQITGISKEDQFYYVITYSFRYYTTFEQEAYVNQQVDTVLSHMELDGKSDYEKILAVYDYITSHVTYDYAHLKNYHYKLKYTAYAALCDGTAVCQGYANLFYRMILELGIDCRLVSGISYSTPHGWNIVRIEGVYYYVDATWDAGDTGDYHWFLKGNPFAEHAVDNNSDYIISYVVADSDYVAGGCLHEYEDCVAQWSSEEYTDAFFYLICSQCADRKLLSGTVTSFVLEEPSCEREGKTAHVVFAEYAGARYESKAFTPIAATGHSYKKPVFTWDSDFHCKAVFDCGNENCRSQKIINCTVRKAILLEAGCEEKGKVEYVAAAEAPEQSSALAYYDRVFGTLLPVGHHFQTGICTNCGLQVFGIPGISKVSVVSSGVTLAWNKMKHADSYRIYRMTDGKWKVLVNATAKLSYIDKTAKPGKSYSYRIKAYSKKYHIWSAYSSARKILVLKTPVVLKAVNVRSRSIYVKWNKNEKCSGTQLQYALSANFHNAKTKTYSGSKVVSKYITRLSKGKYYYVRVRSYKIVNKQKVYSGWSKTKKVKIVK